MTPKHFIDVLIDAYEAAYSVFKAGGVQAQNLAVVLDTAIQAAAAVALNRWHGQGERAELVAAALLRARYGEGAASEAAGLSAPIALAVAMASDPPTREEIAAATGMGA